MYYSKIYLSQNENNPKSINRQMDKPIVVHHTVQFHHICLKLKTTRSLSNGKCINKQYFIHSMQFNH